MNRIPKTVFGFLPSLKNVSIANQQKTQSVEMIPSTPRDYA